jgi:hypothetical protein
MSLARSGPGVKPGLSTRKALTTSVRTGSGLPGCHLPGGDLEPERAAAHHQALDVHEVSRVHVLVLSPCA